jgi:hypothetical protein
MPSTNSKVHFRLFNMQCCRVLICWVNSRPMNYCPECGTFVYPRCKEWIVEADDSAWLKTKTLTMENVNA